MGLFRRIFGAKKQRCKVCRKAVRMQPIDINSVCMALANNPTSLQQAHNVAFQCRRCSTIICLACTIGTMSGRAVPTCPKCNAFNQPLPLSSS